LNSGISVSFSRRGKKTWEWIFVTFVLSLTIKRGIYVLYTCMLDAGLLTARYIKYFS
jgi:hypothetical protein